MDIKARKRSNYWTSETAPRNGGRPRGARDMWMELYKALRQVEKEKKESFAHMLVRKSWDDRKLAAVMSRKFWPDLSHESGDRGSININIVLQSPSSSQKVQVFQPIPSHVRSNTPSKVTSDSSVRLTDSGDDSDDE